MSTPTPSFTRAQIDAALASVPMSPHGPQAPVPLEKQIHVVDRQIYQLASLLKRQREQRFGNPISTQADLQCLRAAVATLKALQAHAPATEQRP